MIIAKYKFNPSIYSNLLPEFNSAFTSYTKSDVNNGDGTITRTIESTSLPTRIKFGYRDDTTNTKVAASSLLEVIELNTDNVNTTRDMFRYCTNLVNVNTTNWNFSGVTDARSMFTSCPSLTSLDLNNWNTSKVTNMNYMFGGCTSLTSLDLSNWDTSNVTDMYYMFYECSSLTQLDLSNWNTSNVIDMAYMFNGCTSLTSLDLSNWNTSKVTGIQGIFNGCSSLTSLDLSNWDISNIVDMSWMFSDCYSLTSLDLSRLNTSNVTNMEGLFWGCTSLTSLDVSNWNISKVTSMNSMFRDCNKLTQLDLNNWNTSKVTNMNNVFQNCPNLRKINLKYANQSTVSKVHENLPDRSSTTEGYILSSIPLTSDKNWETLKVSHNEVYLPQPLRKIGNVKDKFYWDYDKGHYCIEQNVGQVVLDGSEDEDWNITGSSSIDRINTMAFRLSDPMMGSVYNIKCDKFITCSRENSCYNTDNEGVEGIGSEPYYLCLGIKKSKLPTQDVAGLRQWLSSNPTTVFYVLEAPVIIDLPEMNKKLSYDTYLPNTNIDVTNLPLQPYKLLLEDDTVRYKSTIEPSTLYTIQFNCLAKSTTNLTLDLGGTRVTVEPIIGVNHVQITTPSELTSDRLFLIGTGIIVNEVIVNKGDMNQYTKYFDGEQSVGELQEDGSYIIRISTDNYTGLWEGDL